MPNLMIRMRHIGYTISLIKKQKKLADILQDLPKYETSNDFEKIIIYQYKCLKSGINKVGTADLQILDTVIKNKLSLFSLDKHFALMHKYINFNLFL